MRGRLQPETVAAAALVPAIEVAARSPCPRARAQPVVCSALVHIRAGLILAATCVARTAQALVLERAADPVRAILVRRIGAQRGVVSRGVGAFVDVHAGRRRRRVIPFVPALAVAVVRPRRIDAVCICAAMIGQQLGRAFVDVDAPGTVVGRIERPAKKAAAREVARLVFASAMLLVAVVGVRVVAFVQVDAFFPVARVAFLAGARKRAPQVGAGCIQPARIFIAFVYVRARLVPVVKRHPAPTPVVLEDNRVLPPPSKLRGCLGQRARRQLKPAAGLGDLAALKSRR